MKKRPRLALLGAVCWLLTAAAWAQQEPVSDVPPAEPAPRPLETELAPQPETPPQVKADTKGQTPANKEAETEAQVRARRDQYLVGLSVVSADYHIGKRESFINIKPVWSFYVGPVRVSRSRANTLMSAGREGVETGISADFLDLDRFSLGASLRVDNGRSFDDDPIWVGLPDVRTTLRGRLSAGVVLTPQLSLNMRVDKDVLGRGGGARFSPGLNYRYTLSDTAFWDFGASLNYGDRRFMQSEWGISPAGAQAVGRPPYLLGSGWERLELGANLTYAIHNKWVLFGGVDVSSLLSEARKSPLVTRTTTRGITLGVAYRRLQ